MPWTQTLNPDPRNLGEHANFYRIWTGALTLFRVATGDDWSDIFQACMMRVIRVLGCESH